MLWRLKASHADLNAGSPACFDSIRTCSTTSLTEHYTMVSFLQFLVGSAYETLVLCFCMSEVLQSKSFTRSRSK